MDNWHDFYSGVVPAFIAIVFGGALLFVNLLFALGVQRDGDRLREQGREPMFVGPTVWFLGVLIGSFPVVALYWLVNHSNLRVVTPKTGQGT